jgi:hypothetical protein
MLARGSTRGLLRAPISGHPQLADVGSWLSRLGRPSEAARTAANAMLKKIDARTENRVIVHPAAAPTASSGIQD